MNRVVRRLFWVVVVVLVLSGITWAGLAIRQNVVYGEVFTEEKLTASVEIGDRFSLAVPDRGASVGDHWTAQTAPGAGLTFIEERVSSGIIGAIIDATSEPLVGGGGGTRFFTYEATERGTVTVTLSNCFQGCDPARNATFQNDTETRSVVWTITVK